MCLQPATLRPYPYYVPLNSPVYHTTTPAVHPEDVHVPTEVLTALGDMALDKMTLKQRGCLTTLLNYNLLKGSVAEGSGVFMHGE